MNITILNDGNAFNFTDAACKSEKGLVINYNVNYKPLFNVKSIEIRKECVTTKKIIKKKGLFKTTEKEIEETKESNYIVIDYNPHSYSDDMQTVMIRIIDLVEMKKAKEVVNYINDLILQRESLELKERKEKEERQKHLVGKELERLSKCKYDIVVIDFETTGIKSPMQGGKYDEILSVSIIDQDGAVLLHSLCKPEVRKTWAKAQEIHGILPSMVKNQPTFREIFPKVKEILMQSKIVLAYNIEFEMGFLWGYDLEFGIPGGEQLIQNVIWGPDPMLMFSAYKGTERWQKLSTAAKHFKYTFDAHDSLEDVKATLHCYKK